MIPKLNAISNLFQVRPRTNDDQIAVRFAELRILGENLLKLAKGHCAVGVGEKDVSPSRGKEAHFHRVSLAAIAHQFETL